MPNTDEKLTTLNQSLGAIENELLHRRLAAREGDLDAAVAVINDLADQGHVDICPCEEDPPADA